VARTGRVDIGADQSQGFNVAITGGNNQSTPVDTSFPSALSVTVSSAYGEPVAGGIVTFTDPAAGASATFTGNPAVIGANGSASVSATANGTAGIFGNSATYAVSSSTGAGSAMDGPGWNDEKISEAVGCRIRTVENVRREFVLEGFEAALVRKKRMTSPTPKLLDGAAEAKLIALRLGKPPAGYGHWTLRLLADQLVELEIVESISPETVRQTLKKTA
jgi:hypothetical protein